MTKPCSRGCGRRRLRYSHLCRLGRNAYNKKMRLSSPGDARFSWRARTKPRGSA